MPVSLMTLPRIRALCLTRKAAVADRRWGTSGTRVGPDTGIDKEIVPSAVFPGASAVVVAIRSTLGVRPSRGCALAKPFDLLLPSRRWDEDHAYEAEFHTTIGHGAKWTNGTERDEPTKSDTQLTAFESCCQLRGGRLLEYILQQLMAHGLSVVVVHVFASQLGLPVPMIPLLMVMAAGTVAGDVAVGPLFGVAFGACLIADHICYAAGRRYGGHVLHTACRLSISPDSCVSQTQMLFARWGMWTLIVAKFIPGLGLFATALSGQSRVPLQRFALLDALGITLYIGILIWLGRAFHSTINSLLNTLETYGRVGVALVFIGLILYFALRLARRYLLIRTMRMARISVQDFKRLRETDTPYLIYDARAASSRERDGTIPGARPWSLKDTLRPEAPSSLDTQVIVYCDCPTEYSAVKVARSLQRAGFTSVRPLHGGIEAWIAAGQEIERPNFRADRAAAPAPETVYGTRNASRFPLDQPHA